MLGFNLSIFTLSDTGFISPEPRMLFNYSPNNLVSVQFGYSRMKQFTHYLSNSGAGLPSDIWIPATKEIIPEQADQFNAGILLTNIFKQFPLDINVEAFYKKLDHLIDYKEGAALLSAENLSSKVAVNGKGLVYGFEGMIRRRYGKWTGWIAYTYSKNKRQFSTLNNGNWYPFKYDRTHDFSIVCNFQLNNKIDFSATWVYMTGLAMTLAQGKYEYIELDPALAQDGQSGMNTYDAHLYNGKNNVRMPAYHRLDLGVNFTKKKLKGTRIWTISIYNLYNHQNSFFYFYKLNSQGVNTLYQMTIFPILPSFSYRFRFE